MEEINGLMPEGNVEYTEDNIRHLDDMEHIRVRSGMYIGRLGDGTQNDDGIYVLLKEVMDNSIDEFKMGAGKRIEINIEENLRVSEIVLREDDKPETVQKRLKVYHEQTQPLIDYYKNQGILKSVDGTQPMDEVFKAIVTILGA